MSSVFYEALRLALNDEWDMAVQHLSSFLAGAEDAPAGSVLNSLKQIKGLSEDTVNVYSNMYSKGQAKELYKQLCLFYLDRRLSNG